MLLLGSWISLALLAYSALASSGNAGSALYPPGLQPLILQANTFLSTGQFNDAIKAYSDAIEQSPIDYSLYYKRATAYYSVNRLQQALQDFEKVLELTNYTFDKALLMKGRIHAKEGDWNNARDMLKRYSSRVKGDTSAGDLLFEVSEGEIASKKATQSRAAGLYQACVDAATEALKVATHSVKLRELRAECALHSGDVQQTVGDFIRVTHLTAPSTSLLLKIAQLSYFILPPSIQAQTTLKQCLHYDPDSKPCASLHRKIKNFDKSLTKLNSLREGNDWRGIITLLYKASDKDNVLGTGVVRQFEDELLDVTSKLELPENVSPKKMSELRKEFFRGLCQAYVRADQAKRADFWCEELLRFEGNSEDVDGLVGRGEALLAKEMWEDAVRAFEKAFEVSGRSRQDIAQRLQKAQRLLKQSRSKDYYKVLGVARDADERTIKKAYRKAAIKAHPDKGGSEAQMAAINEAYEVLSDPELRQRFDNGDDPNDPMAQSGGHPFQQGAHPFMHFFQSGGGGGFRGNQFHQGGGGGFQFHFAN